LDDTVNFPAVKRLHKNDDPRQVYTISKIKEQRMSNFKTLSTSYKVTFKDIEMTDDAMSTLKKIKTIITDITHGIRSEDRVRNPFFDYPIFIPFVKVQQLTMDQFMAEIERV